MAIFTKTVKSEPPKPQVEIQIKTPKIVRHVRAKIRPIAKILVVIGCLQLFSGIYGTYHVHKYGEGGRYHHYIHCQREMKIGAYTEYQMEFFLGFLLLVPMQLKRPFSFVRLWVYFNWFILAMSLLTLFCAYQHNMASDLLFSGIIWLIIHFIPICFGSIYCNLVQEEGMMVRLVPLICRQRFLVKQMVMEKLHQNQTPEATV